MSPDPAAPADSALDPGRNVADLLTQQARLSPAASAIVHGELTLSYAELESLLWGLCARLHEAGLRRGAVVGVQLQDPLVHLAALLALARSGMVSVPVAGEGDDKRVALDLLARTGALAVLDDAAHADWGRLRSIGLSLEQLLGGSGRPDRGLRDPEPAGWMMFKASSGTTGTPKIVGATHAGMWASIVREQLGIGYPAGERYMTPVSLRMDGPRRRYLACLAAGATAVMPPRLRRADHYLAAIERQAISHFSCVGSQAHEMARLVGKGPPRFPALRCFRLSAGPSDAALHQRIRERLTPNVLVSYGCSELGPLTVADPELLARWPQSVGRPLPGVEVQVVSAQGEPLPAPSAGEIRLRAEGMPLAYHDDEAASARGFRDGWFYPGDLGRLDAQGLLFHLGRNDDMLVMDGVNIYPAEIEQAMHAHPAVADAAAASFRHPVLHDVPICAVALQGPADAAELLAHARRRLGVRSPRQVVVLPAIPRTEQGKLRRAELAQAIEAELGANAATAKPAADAGPTPTSAVASGPPAGAPLPQLSAQARLKLRVPDETAARQLDEWLRRVFGIEPPPAPQAAAPTQAAALGWLRRVLLLQRELLQAFNAPLFDLPRVLALSPLASGPGHFEASVSFPLIEGTPMQTYQLAFSESLALADWVAQHPVAEDHVEAFCARVEARLAEGLRHFLRGRKSTLPVLRVAHQRSIPFMHLGGGVFQLGWGWRGRRLLGSVTERDSAIGSRLCGNKALTASLLRQAGLPAPDHQLCLDQAMALRAAQRIGWPVVVKPTDQERGEGVAVNVRDAAQLAAAFDAALARSPRRQVLVEEQIPGVCHRLFIAQGRLLYAVKRMPMSVQGDGVSDVATLVAAEVARQRLLPTWRRSPIQPLDDAARSALQAAGLSPQGVPAAGQWAPLRAIESTALGGVDEEVTHRLHPHNLAVALAAAELLGLEMAGVDIISADITRPWHSNGARINEVNFAPLLGGAEISRSHIAAFLERYIDGDGSVPVEVFAGGRAAWTAARLRWRALTAGGQRAFFSDAQRSFDGAGRLLPMLCNGLCARARALVLNPQVQALVLVVQTDEVLSAGLPLQAASRVEWVDDVLTPEAQPRALLAPERLAAVRQLLQSWPRLPPRDAGAATAAVA